MGKRKVKKTSGSVSLGLTLPAPLVARIDDMLTELRRQNPYRYVSRSAFVAYAIAEWAALINDPHRDPQPMTEVSKRARRPSFVIPPNAMNPNAQLTVEDVRAIRRDDRTCQVIAAEMGVADSTVARVKSGATWGWVT